MKQYLMSLFVLALCCAVVELLAPEGEGGGIARHIRLLGGLCLLCVAVAPLATYARQGVSPLGALLGAVDEWLDESEQSGEDFEARWEEQSEALDLTVAAETVAQMIEERFSLNAADCRVSLTTDGQGELLEVRVALSGRAIWTDAHAIQTMIDELLGCDCTVYIE